ncbi:hypothetical protein FQA39_LY17623 [Lamprigera yunnana]|nr:hypothetical protein FQA39_LY17623 [Lamprigera yunnana]
MLFVLKLFVYILLCLIYLNKEGTCLECFNCLSLVSDNCGIEFNRQNTNIKACPAACNACFKAQITTPENKTLILRSCGSDYHCMLYDTEGCYICNKNFCNGSLKLKPQLLLTVLFLLQRMCGV